MSRRIILLSTILFLFALPVAGLAGETPTLKVGTFDSRCVAFAYGKTDAFMKHVGELKREYAEAKADGDTDRMAELEAAGKGLQHEMHLMVFCGAPIPDVLDRVRDRIPEAAAAAGVDLIVEGVLFEGPGVEVVDVSAEMAALFTDSPEVLAMLPEIMAAPVVDPSELEGHEH